MPPVLTTVLEGRVMSYLKMWVHKSVWMIFLIWVLMGSQDLTKSYQKIISPGSSLEILKNTTHVSSYQKWTTWMETSNHNTGCIGYILLVASLGSQLIAGICSWLNKFGPDSQQVIDKGCFSLPPCRFLHLWGEDQSWVLVFCLLLVTMKIEAGTVLTLCSLHIWFSYIHSHSFITSCVYYKPT